MLRREKRKREVRETKKGRAEKKKMFLRS